MVIVPALVPSVEAVEQSPRAPRDPGRSRNIDPMIHFALVTDFTDAPQEEMPDDAEILAAAIEGIDDARTRATAAARTIASTSSTAAGSGTRAEELLDGLGAQARQDRGVQPAPARRDGHELHHDPAATSRSSRRSGYCITLDSDTRLPRDTAKELIGIALHPLHRPATTSRARAASSRATAILQPRVSVTMSSAAGSIFSRMYAGHTGVDPYTTRRLGHLPGPLRGRQSTPARASTTSTRSPRALAGRVPENAVLSHDLFEGLFARCALVSDLEVVDDYPSTVLAHTQATAPMGAGRLADRGLDPSERARPPAASEKNPLPCISRWKIFDNLRRSLVRAGAPRRCSSRAGRSCPAVRSHWTLAAVGVLALPVVRSLGSLLGWPQPRRAARGLPAEPAPKTSGPALAQTGIAIVLLLHHARRMSNAIVVTLWRDARLEAPSSRLGVRRPHVAPRAELRAPRLPRRVPGQPDRCGADLPRRAPGEARGRCRSPRRSRPSWFAAPVARVLAEPARRVRRAPQLEAADLAFLHRVARRTWSCFETLRRARRTTDLPPDNWQEGPVESIAHRTSPTNIGLGAALDARRARPRLHRRPRSSPTGSTARSPRWRALERHEGHLLNWYDTKSLAPLRPRYVSTVDSGNLAAALIALAHGLREIAERPPDRRAAPRRMSRHRRRPPRERARRRGGPGDEGGRLALVPRLKALEARARELGRRERSRSPDRRSRPRRAGARGVPRGAPATAERPPIVEWGAKLLAALRSPDEDEPPRARLEDLADARPRVRRRACGSRSSSIPSGSSSRSDTGSRTPTARAGIDKTYYDLLASEARLASFLAIAKEEVAAGALVPARARRSCRSTAGRRSSRGAASMFEYLMPLAPDEVAPGHAPRPELPERGAPADRLRPVARRAVGHQRIGIRLRRPVRPVPVPRVRSSGSRPQARPRGRRRDRRRTRPRSRR